MWPKEFRPSQHRGGFQQVAAAQTPEERWHQWQWNISNAEINSSMRRGLLAKASPPKSPSATNSTTFSLEKHGYLPRVGYVQLRAFSNSSISPNPYNERKPLSRGNSRHQSQAHTFNFSLMVFLFLPMHRWKPWSSWREQPGNGKWGAKTGTAVVVSPPKRGDKVAVGGTGSPAWAGTGGLAQSSLLSACHKSAPKQVFHAAINLLKE